MTVTHIGIEPEQQEHSEPGLDMHQVLAKIPGMTYRQLDYWSRTGRIKAMDRGPMAGSGINRRWSEDQVAIASRMLRLIHRGLDVDAAHAIATDHGVLMELLSELTKIEAELACQS